MKTERTEEPIPNRGRKYSGLVPGFACRHLHTERIRSSGAKREEKKKEKEVRKTRHSFASPLSSLKSRHVDEYRFEGYVTPFLMPAFRLSAFQSCLHPGIP